MAKNNSWIFWIGLGIVVFLVVTQTDLLKPKQEEFASIKATYYDANKNPIDFKPYNYEEAMKQSEPVKEQSVFENFISRIKSFFSSIQLPRNIQSFSIIDDIQISPVSSPSEHSDGGSELNYPFYEGDG